MQVQVHTDNHVNGSAGLTAHVESVVTGALERFGNRVTRVEVHIGDENGHKGGEHDKRCAMEARLSGLQPIAVTGQGTIVEAAISAAVDKLVRTIDRTLEKKYGAKGRTSTAEFAANGAVETEESDEILTAED
jgi:ribosome-associated translation inhibitor RaiA